MIKKERNIQLDFLRFIGISCIILAHQDIPSFLFQLRNFDVPLMVLVSGISYVRFSEKHYKSYFIYLKNRFIRLVIPTWLFLIFYNFFLYIYSSASVNYANLFKQFMLVGGTDIGVWIIRVFASMAIIAPVISFYNNKCEKNIQYYLSFVSILIFYIFIYYISKKFTPQSIFDLLNLIIFPTVGYSLLLWHGMRIDKFDKKNLKFQIFLSASIFTALFFYLYFKDHSLVQTQLYKYPPRPYYLLYAMMISILLYHLSENFSIPLTKFVQFIGSSTLWIYLWHWFVMRLYNHFQFNFHYIINYLVVYTLSVFIVYIQYRIVLIFIEKSSISNKSKKFVRKILTG